MIGSNIKEIEILKYLFRAGADQKQYDIFQNIIAVIINAYENFDSRFKNALKSLVNDLFLQANYEQGVLKLRVYNYGNKYSYLKAFKDLASYAFTVVPKYHEVEKTNEDDIKQLYEK